MESALGFLIPQNNDDLEYADEDDGADDEADHLVSLSPTTKVIIFFDIRKFLSDYFSTFFEKKPSNPLVASIIFCTFAHAKK